jgi:hypothetical protein
VRHWVVGRSRSVGTLLRKPYARSGGGDRGQLDGGPYRLIAVAAVRLLSHGFSKGRLWSEPCWNALCPVGAPHSLAEGSTVDVAS